MNCLCLVETKVMAERVGFDFRHLQQVVVKTGRSLLQARLWTASRLLQAAIENLARMAPVETL